MHSRLGTHPSRVSWSLSAAMAILAPFAFSADTFDASPKVRVVHEKPAPSNGTTSNSGGSASNGGNRSATVRIKVNEIQPIYAVPKGAKPEMAFYLPPEGVAFVQLIVEKRGSQITYFAKGMCPGKTVGGAVERRWLDSTGFSPRSIPDEARIQQAVKMNPLFIEVH